MPSDEAVRGEITRRLDEIAEGQRELKTEVMGEIKELRAELPKNYVRKDVLDALLAPIQAQLVNIVSTHTWLTRTVGVLIITAVLGLVLTVGSQGVR